jgi:hypothetical protein
MQSDPVLAEPTGPSAARRHRAGGPAGIANIPGAVTSLPAALPDDAELTDPAGAKQPDAFSGDPGYAGPCPPEEHTYRFTIYAVDVATLGGVDLGSSVQEVETALEAAALGTATLSGTYERP